ncbi:MAG: hypothetical protein JNK60_09250 [Acidobacteria bacterium]|nr:hypothetical protein [Acidobacteriota bacterium]
MRSPAAALALGLLLSAEALAWDPETHTGLEKAARLVSPAFAARLPLDFKDEFQRELAQPDLMDKICRNHRGPEAKIDVFAEAERQLLELRKPLRPYPRAQAIARYLHYVADCVVPPALASGQKFQLEDFWTNRDFILYRDRRPLAEPLAASLRLRAQEAAAAGGKPEAYTLVLRLALNTLVDAALLIPPRPGTERELDGGPLVFVVNRADNGYSGSQTDAFLVSEYYRQGNYIARVSYVAEMKSGGEGKKQADLMNRPGVQVAEAVEKSGPSGRVWEALLFNNTATCARKLRASAGGWALDYPDVMPPQSLLRVSATLPPGVPAAAVQLGYEATSCTGETPSAQAITGQRLVIGGSGGVPRFESAVRDTRALEANDAPRTSVLGDRPLAADAKAVFGQRGGPGIFSAEVPPAVEQSLQGLASLATVKVRRDGSLWQAVVPVRNTSKALLGILHVTFGITPEDGGPERFETISIDLASLLPDQSETRSARMTLQGEVNPRALRIQSARIGPAGSLPDVGKIKAPKVTNTVPLN